MGEREFDLQRDGWFLIQSRFVLQQPRLGGKLQFWLKRYFSMYRFAVEARSLPEQPGQPPPSQPSTLVSWVVLLEANMQLRDGEPLVWESSLCEYFSLFEDVAGCFLALSQGDFLAMLQPSRGCDSP